MYNYIGDIMDDSIVFKTKEELYNRVLPALYSKLKEVKRLGFNYITEKDIWNYLVENEWTRRNNLELYDLIKDILYIDNYKLRDYVVNKMNRLKIESKEELKDLFNY